MCNLTVRFWKHVVIFILLSNVYFVIKLCLYLNLSPRFFRLKSKSTKFKYNT